MEYLLIKLFSKNYKGIKFIIRNLKIYKIVDKIIE